MSRLSFPCITRITRIAFNTVCVCMTRRFHLTRIARIPRILCAAGLACIAITPHALQAASATSDALFVLESDGVGFTAQYTIASDGPLVVLDIPADATTRQFEFLGPNRDQHAQSNASQHHRIQLWDGVALVRYRHRYRDEIVQTGPRTYRLSIPSLPLQFGIEDGEITRSSYSWVFPENLELLTYSAIADDMGRWQLDGHELTYEQSERFAVTLSIEYKVHDTTRKSAQQRTAHLARASEAFCLPTASDPDRCATDSDEDKVPDYRDVCPGKTLGSTDASTHSPEKAVQWQRLIGCEGSDHLILNEVQFPSGYSYLDVSSRKMLDRLAEALQTEALQSMDGSFEIGAHTDNRGDEQTNLVLAGKRAETVRYYLLLRGVKPNQLRAKGYGEAFPLFDNHTAEGQRGNRRIEITALQ